jgi:hypothetical protein
MTGREVVALNRATEGACNVLDQPYDVMDVSFGAEVA